MKATATLIFLLVTGLWLDAQTTINGVTLPGSVSRDNISLVLNGGGIRKKLFIKVYVAGVYVQQKTNNAASIIDDDKPVAIRLVITSGMVNSDNMSDAIKEGFSKSMNGNTAPLQSQIDAFISTFKKEGINEGDVFEIWYEPGVGVKAYKGGVLKSVVQGLDFKKALFGIWFGNSPVDGDLKNGLLGH